MCPNKESEATLCSIEERRRGCDGEEKRVGGGFFIGFGWPYLNEVAMEVVSLGQIVWPIVVTGLLLYSRSVISMLFLGHLGDAQLAGGSLAVAFANITGYSLLKGLSMGMEPICGQAFGARRWSLLSLTFQRTLLLLLLSTLPVSLLWLHTQPILLHLGQSPSITSIAQDYLLFSIPDLLGQALLHPLRVFLRAQILPKPIALSALVALLFHLPINYFFIFHLNLGVRGVALASSLNTININLGLMGYLFLSAKAVSPWAGLSSFHCFKDWAPLVGLAAPSAVSVCLEWWWYEVMLILCGLLREPQSSVAAMGILIQTTGLIYVLPSSLGMGLSMRVGNELGAGRPGPARLAAWAGLGLSAVVGLSAFVFTLGVREVWGKMFTGEHKILELTAAALPIVGFCELGNCPQTAGCGVLRGSARPTVGANINFSSFYLIGLPVAALAGFGFGYGFIGLWVGLVAAQGACLCLMMCTVARTDWEVQAARAEELTTAAGGGGKSDLEAKLLNGE